MISLQDIQDAANRIAPYIQKTTLTYVDYLSKLTGINIYLKLENMQNSGSFKMRGACNRVAFLTEDEKKRGVIAASAGNHAQGVACSALLAHTHATIVMPQTSPISKIKATRDYGAEVILHGDNFDEAFTRAKEIEKVTNKVFIHAFDDDMIIAGQGTIGLEILEQLPNTDAIVVPVGGGGLIGGIAVASKTINKNIAIIGVQSEKAPSMYESLKNNHQTFVQTTPTIADGIAIGMPGSRDFEIAKQYVDEIVTVSDEDISSAILSLLEKRKIVAEGSGAVGVAALFNHKLDKFIGKNVVIVISGGNIDINVVESIINCGLMNDGRRFKVTVKVKHKIGELEKLLDVISKTGGNIYSIEQTRYDQTLGITEQQVTIVIDTFDEEHQKVIKEQLLQNGYM